MGGYAPEYVKYGYEKAQQLFIRNYIEDKGNVKNANAHLENVLDGKLEYLKMVKGVEDSTYVGLMGRYERLTHKPNSDTTDKDIQINENELDIMLNKLTNNDFDLSLL